MYSRFKKLFLGITVAVMLFSFLALAQPAKTPPLPVGDFTPCLAFDYPNSAQPSVSLFTEIGSTLCYAINDGTTLHVIDIQTNKEQRYSLEPVQDHSYGYLSLNFIDASTVVLIGADEKTLIVFDLKGQKITKTIDFTPFLKPLEYLYVTPNQRIEKIDDKLIVPTIFGSISYKDQKARQKIFKYAPFMVYDLSAGAIIRPPVGAYWPSIYKDETYFDDYVPKFGHNGKDELYLNYRYADSMVVYNLDHQTIKKTRLKLPEPMPVTGLDPDATRADERQFRITTARTYNYTYNIQAKRHIILFKPTADFIVNDRINRYENIDWWLLEYNDSFQLVHQQLVKMAEVEWHILTNKNNSILLSGGIERPNESTIKQHLQCLTL